MTAGKPPRAPGEDNPSFWKCFKLAQQHCDELDKLKALDSYMRGRGRAQMKDQAIDLLREFSVPQPLIRLVAELMREDGERLPGMRVADPSNAQLTAADIEAAEATEISESELARRLNERLGTQKDYRKSIRRWRALPTYQARKAALRESMG